MLQRLAVTTLVAGLLVACANTPQLSEREQLFGSLFSGAEQYNKFNRIKELVPTTTLNASTRPYVFPAGHEIELPATYNFRGQPLATQAFLEQTDTAALLVLKNGKVRHESYSLTGGPQVNWLSMSVAKSFISALIGMKTIATRMQTLVGSGKCWRAVG